MKECLIYITQINKNHSLIALPLRVNIMQFDPHACNIENIFPQYSKKNGLKCCFRFILGVSEPKTYKTVI